MTYPSAMTHLEDRTDLVEAAAALFGYVVTGRIRIAIGQRFPPCGSGRGPPSAGVEADAGKYGPVAVTFRPS